MGTYDPVDCPTQLICISDICQHTNTEDIAVHPASSDDDYGNDDDDEDGDDDDDDDDDDDSDEQQLRYRRVDIHFYHL